MRNELCWVYIVVLYLFPLISMADVPVWKIIAEESSLTFNATQNDAPVVGKFLTFHGEVQFDKNQLDKSRVSIVIDMNSVSAEFEDLVFTLKTEEWFDTGLYPKAQFEAANFTHQKDQHYQGKGKLTIRDNSIAVIVDFELLTYTSDRAVAKGSVKTERLLYGVGQGEWQSTDEVKNEVKIDFILTTQKISDLIPQPVP